jgi:hypothetical protein
MTRKSHGRMPSAQGMSGGLWRQARTAASCTRSCARCHSGAEQVRLGSSMISSQGRENITVDHWTRLAA